MKGSQNTYACKVKCNNCDFNGEVDITKGETIVNVLMVLPCPNCGCETLEKFKQIQSPIILSKPSNPYNPLVSREKDKYLKDMFGSNIGKSIRTSMTSPKLSKQFSI